MKVALLQNNNNINFTKLRYLRNLGLDAHLILMEKDNSGYNAHFAPIFDTWELEKWEPYIHKINFNIWVGLLFIPGFFLKKYFEDYDIIIGSSYTPALLKKCGIKLDIYYPTGEGIEGVGDQYTRLGYPGKPLYKKILLKYARKKMIKALKFVRQNLTQDIIYAKRTYDELGIPFKRFYLTMYYNQEDNKNSKISDALQGYIDIIKKYDIKFLCHMRHDGFYKIHRPYLEGFAKYIKNNKDQKVVLILMQYGINTDSTKEIIKELDIAEHILWLPLLSRKEISYLMNYIDFGFNNFENAFWGGTGWEFLANGIPFFHYYDISPEKYEKEFGTPKPRFISTNNPDEICQHLINYSQNPKPYKELGAELADWFNKYGGIGLAEKWKELIIEIYNQKNGYNK